MPERLAAARMADRSALMPPSGSDVAAAAASAAAAGPDPLSPVPLTSRYHYLNTDSLCALREHYTCRPETLKGFFGAQDDLKNSSQLTRFYSNCSDSKFVTEVQIKVGLN